MSTLIRKYGISLLLLVAIGTALNHPAVAQQLVGRIVASVNDDAITDFDIDARSRLLLASSNSNKSTAELNRVKRAALNELIHERLKLQEAKRLGIEATENEIKAAISTIEKDNKKQPGGIFQELTQLGVPIDTFVQRIKATVVWRKVLRRRVVPEVKIASAEVKDAVQKVEASEDKTLVRIAEI
ncbi:MAG: SurA N-terminal domain-containing protein, partial [Rhodospirillales bacterium]